MSSKSGANPAEPTYVGSARELEDVFNEMRPMFEGKESEQNWGPRDKSILKLRKITKGNAPEELTSTYLSGIKSLLDGILKVANSLRTTPSTNACNLIQEIAQTAGSGIDNMVEILLQSLIKLCASTKTINTVNGNATVTAVFANVSYTPRLMQHIWAACQEKNVQPRKFAAGWLMTLISKHRRTRHVLEHGSGLELVEKCLKHGLTDANPGVRESMRPTYWAFARVWPEKSEPIMLSLDSKAQQLLIDNAGNPNRQKLDTSTPSVAPGATKSTSKAMPKPSIKDTIAAKRREVEKVKPVVPSSTSRLQAAAPVTRGLSSAPMRPSRMAKKATDTSKPVQVVPIKKENEVPKGKVDLSRPISAGSLSKKLAGSSHGSAESSHMHSPTESLFKIPAVSKTSSGTSSPTDTESLSKIPATSDVSTRRSSRAGSFSRIPVRSKTSSRGSSPTSSSTGSVSKIPIPTNPKISSHTMRNYFKYLAAYKKLSREASPSAMTSKVSTPPNTSPRETSPEDVKASTATLPVDIKVSTVTSPEDIKVSTSTLPEDVKASTAVFVSSPSETSIKPQTPDPVLRDAASIPLRPRAQTPTQRFSPSSQPSASREEGKAARKALEELPVKEPVRGRSEISQAVELPLLDEDYYPEDYHKGWKDVESRVRRQSPPLKMDDTRMVNQLLASAIHKISMGTLNVHGFRRLQGILKGADSILQTDTLFQTLLFRLLDQLEKPIRSDDIRKCCETCKSHDVQTQILCTLRLMLELEPHCFKAYFPRTLCALINARNNHHFTSHMVMGIEETTTDIIRLCGPGELEDSIDAILDLVESDISGDPEPAPFEQEERLGKLAAKYLQSEDGDVRRAVTEYTLEYFDFLNNAQRFWSLVAPRDQDHVALITYYLARREQIRLQQIMNQCATRL
ncbi:MAG: hypothetical protein Q9167_001993 [Letrouitia subvulpina]